MMKENNISINKNEHLPFNQRMEKRCSKSNAFYEYRRNRVELLEDHEAKVEEEPFHIRYLRSLERFSGSSRPASSLNKSPGKMSEKLKEK